MMYTAKLKFTGNHPLTGDYPSKKACIDAAVSLHPCFPAEDWTCIETKILGDIERAQKLYRRYARLDTVMSDKRIKRFRAAIRPLRADFAFFGKQGECDDHGYLRRIYHRD